MAGKNRANTLSAILSNMRDLEDAYESALNAEGSALKENETYLDSIQGRIDLFNNAVQTLWMNALDSEALKIIIDFGTALVKIADTAGPISTLIGVFTGIKTAISSVKTQLDAVKNGTFKFFGSLSESAKSSTKNANAQASAIQGVVSATEKETNATKDKVKVKQKETDASNANIAARELENAEQQKHNVQTGQEIVQDAAEAKGTWAQVAAEKALAVVKGLGTGLLTGLASYAISAAISGIITSITEASKKMEEMTQNAIDSANKLKDARDSIEDYKEEIQDLRKTLADSTTTEQEAYDARARLIEIQNELTGSYGKEVENINLVTGAIDQQIAKLDELSRKKAEQWFIDTDENGASNQEVYNRAEALVNAKNDSKGFIFYNDSKTTQKVYDQAIGGYIDQITYGYSGELAKLTEAEREAYISGLTEIIEKNGGIVNSWSSAWDKDDDYSQTFNYLRADFEGKTTEELKLIFDEMLGYINKFGTEHRILMDDQIKVLSAELDKFDTTEYKQAVELYNLGRQNRAISQYSKEYGSILNAEGSLYDATNDKDRLNFIREYQSAVDAAIKSTKNGEEIFDQPMYDYFTELQNKFAKEEFELRVKTDEDGLKGEIESIINAAGESGLSQLDNNQIGDLFTRYISGQFAAGAPGTYVDYSMYTKEQVDGIVQLASVADEAGIEVEELINILTTLGMISGRPEDAAVKQIRKTITSIDALSSALESYKTVIETVNDITFDGQAISEEYYNTLKEQLSDVTVAEEDLSDAIDKQNGKYIVKNIALLRQLVNQSKIAKQATITVAKAQSQLQYKEIVKEMLKSVYAMKQEYNAYGFVTKATINNVDAMRDQIEAIKETIQQYSRLELSLTSAAEAYAEYEAAKARDTEIAYDDSMLEMLKTIDEGLLKNETGTEAFEYSVRAIVPEEFWKDIDDVDKKVKSIHDYIDGNEVFSKLFHVDDESGELDINADNVRAFVDMLKEAKVIIGDSTDFSLNPDVYGIEDVAKSLGITEAAALALLAATEKVDAKWGDILTDVMNTPLEREVNAQVDALDIATNALDDYWSAVSSGDIKYSEETYNALVQDIAAATTNLNAAEKAAYDNAKMYNLCHSAIASYRGELTLSTGEAESLAKALGFIDKNGKPTISVNSDGSLQLTEDDVAKIAAMIAEIEKPAIVRMQLRYDEIVPQIQELQDYIDKECRGSITIDGVAITNKEDAEAKLNELTPEKSEIELTYNITETSSEEQKSVLESYQELAKNGLEFTVTAQVDDAIDSLKSIADRLDQISSKTITVTVNTETVETTVPEKNANAYWDPVTETWKKKVSNVNGTAHATGSWGAPKTETALVGELGPEMLVRDGRWTTIGNNGAEFREIKKGDIIFNHKQTEDLLSKGYITGRGKIHGSSAFASGTAYYDYGVPSYHPNLEDNTSFKNGSDVNEEWDDAASTLGDAADNLSDATDEFKDTIDWIAIRMEELDETLGLLSAKLENIAYYSEKNNIIDEMININKQKFADSRAGADYYESYASKYWSQIPYQYQEFAKNGAIAISDFAGEADEAVVEAINKYREYTQNAANLTQQAEEVITEIRDLAIKRIDNAYESGKVRADVEDSQTEKLQNMVDLDEAKGLITSDQYYLAMMENSTKKIEYLSDAREAMQKEFDAAVRNGELIVGSNEWYEKLNDLYGIDAEIAEATIEIEEFNNAINDIHWDNFENLTNQISYIKDQTQSLIDLMEHSGDLVYAPEDVEFWTADDVKWTKEGLTTLGLYAQQMEIAEFEAKQYAEAIDQLNEQYANGRYSESEYLEKLDELTSAQYDSIEAYHDAKDAIVELNKERIEMIKKGIEKEINAYEELINKKKESLNADKEVHDFEKNVMDQQQSILEIKRKLDALEFDTSASAMAQKARLEEQLAKASAELKEIYLDKSLDDQQNALDKELESFQDTKDKEVEELEKYLENVELVVTESLNVIQSSTGVIYDTLSEKAKEYDLTLSDAIMSPWQDGMLAVDDYKEHFGNSMSYTIDKLNALKNKWQEVINQMTSASKINIDAINQQNNNYASATKQSGVDSWYTSSNYNSSSNTGIQQSSGAIAIGGKINASGATIYSNSAGGGASKQYFANDPVYTVLDEQNGYILVRHHSLSSGFSGWFRKSDVKSFAKGTTSLDKSGIVNIDELGEELLIRAKNGRLTYMEKGSGVVPASLTENLMKWGHLDPTSMIEENRPSITAPVLQQKEINIDITYGDILHIEEFHGDDPENIAKIVSQQFDKHTKNLNNAIRKFAR